MDSVKEEVRSFSPIADISLLEFVRSHGQRSVKRAIWDARLERIRSFFDGGTDAEEEQKALNILVGADSADELLFLIGGLGFDALDDDLIETDVNLVVVKLSELLDRRDYRVNRVLRRFLEDPLAAPGLSSQQLTDLIRTPVTNLDQSRRDELAQEIVDGRDAILDGLANLTMRGLPTNAGALRVLMDHLVSLDGSSSPDVDALSWAVHYTDLICRALARQDVQPIVLALPDMVDPTFSDARRTALLDMLARWERFIVALDSALQLVGEAHQLQAMTSFRDAVGVFVTNFPQTTPAPDALETITDFFGPGASDIGGLRSAVADWGDGIASAIEDAFSLFNDMSDDDAIVLTNTMFSQDLLWALPLATKVVLMHRILDGAVEDEEEGAILQLLRTTRDHSRAEALQLVGAGTWEIVENRFDGVESDEFYEVMDSIVGI